MFKCFQWSNVQIVKWWDVLLLLLSVLLSLLFCFVVVLVARGFPTDVLDKCFICRSQAVLYSETGHHQVGADLIILVLVSQSWIPEKDLRRCSRHTRLVVWTNPPQDYWLHWERAACAHDRVAYRMCFQGHCLDSRCRGKNQSRHHHHLQSQSPDTHRPQRIGWSCQHSPQTSIYFVNWAPFVGRSPSFCCCKAESKNRCKILPRIFIIIMMRIVVTGTDMI